MPYGGSANMRRQFARWPAYRKMYIRAFNDMLLARKAAGKPETKWESGEDVFRWWISDSSKKYAPIEGQIKFEI